MAEEQEYETYVKLGRRGLIERTPGSARDLVNMQGTGWVRKGSPNAPSDAAIAAVEKKVAEETKRSEGRISPTSAVAAAANPDAVNALPAGAQAAEVDAEPKKKSGSSSSSAKSAPADAAA